MKIVTVKWTDGRIEEYEGKSIHFDGTLLIIEDTTGGTVIPDSRIRWFTCREAESKTSSEGTSRSERVKRLLTLIEQNPDLPIVPMVDGEVCQGEECNWMGGWGTASVTRYWAGEDGVYFYQGDGLVDDEAINDPACEWDYDDLDDDEALEVYKNLPWTDCIAVYITLPDA